MKTQSMATINFTSTSLQAWQRASNLSKYCSAGPSQPLDAPAHNSQRGPLYPGAQSVTAWFMSPEEHYAWVTAQV
eukprot:2965973-Prymnesium_polylepis.2